MEYVALVAAIASVTPSISCCLPWVPSGRGQPWALHYLGWHWSGQPQPWVSECLCHSSSHVGKIWNLLPTSSLLHEDAARFFLWGPNFFRLLSGYLHSKKEGKTLFPICSLPPWTSDKRNSLCNLAGNFVISELIPTDRINVFKRIVKITSCCSILQQYIS